MPRCLSVVDKISNIIRNTVNFDEEGKEIVSVQDGTMRQLRTYMLAARTFHFPDRLKIYAKRFMDFAIGKIYQPGPSIR